MSDQRHDPPPWSSAPSSPAGWAPYEEDPRDGSGPPSGHTQFPPAAGQGDDGYAGPETQLGMALHEESAAAQQTAYLPPVTDAGAPDPYGSAYGDGSYEGGQGPAAAGRPGGHGPEHGGQGSAAAGRPGGQGPAAPGHSGGQGTDYGSGAPGGHGPAYGGGYAGGAGQAQAPAAAQGAGAVDETAYLPPVTDDGPAAHGAGVAPSAHGGHGGGHAPHGGGAAEQTAYLPPVTEHGGPGGDAAQWPDGWERRDSAPQGPGAAGAAGAGGPAHHGAGAAGGPMAGHPGTPPATGLPGDPSAGGAHAAHSTGQYAADGAHGAHGAHHPGEPGGVAGGFPGPRGPETGTLYGAPTTRRPKPPAEVLREEGTSPLIAPGPQPAALTAALAALLAVTAALDVRPGLAVAVALLQGVTAAGWFRLNGMWPAREGIALAVAAGLTATVAVVAADEDDATVAALGSLGVWLLLIAMVQLRSTNAPKERLTALNAALTAATLAVLASGYLAAERHAVVVGAVAVAAGTLGRAVPLPPNASPVAAVAAAGLGGLLAGLGTDMGAAGGLLGLAAGVCVLGAVRVASFDYPSRFVHMTAGVSLPLTLSVPAVHLLGLALL